jgi:hypothetical protein
MRLPYDVAARVYITHAKNFVIHLCGYNSLAAPWGREYANRSAVRLRQSLLFLGRVKKEDQIVVIEDLRTAAGNNQLNFVQQI